MRALALAGAAALGTATPLEAAVYVVDYDISGLGGTGTMSLNYDTSTSDYTLESLFLTTGAGAGGPFTPFDSILEGSPGLTYRLYGELGGPDVVDGAYDFALYFDPDLSSQTVDMAFTFGMFVPPVHAPVTVTRLASAVPEPETWMFMLMGFGGVGFAIRRRKVSARKLPRAA